MIKGNLNKAILLLLAFVEGVCFTSFELIITKLSAPYYGTDVNVWAMFFSVILAGLGLGYMLSFNITKNNKIENLLNVYICLILIYTIIFFFSNDILSYSLSFNKELGLFISTLILSLIIPFLYGLVSPVIVDIINSVNQLKGESTSNVFFISTFGSAIGVLLFGIVAIPMYGLIFSQFISIGLLFFSLVLIFYVKKNR